MLRVKSSIAEVLPVENYIILNTNHTKYSNGENSSKAFIKQYNIYMIAEGNKEIEFLFSMVPSAIVKFWYDYRSYTAEIKMNDFDYILLCKELPKLKTMIKGIVRSSSNNTILIESKSLA